MIDVPTDADRADVQRLVAYGYDLERSRHFLLEVTDAGAARTFLGGLVAGRFLAGGAVRNDDARVLGDQGYCPANVGFTFRGLQVLQLAVPYLRVFQEKSAAFSEGAYRRSARYLADTGASAAASWEPCYDHRRVHVLLSIHADGARALDDCTARLQGLAGADGLRGWYAGRLDGSHLTSAKQGRTAHFGFRDGIASPGIKGFHEEKRGRVLHEPGEFLLGYRNDRKFNPWLLVNPWSRPNPWLLPLNRAPGLREFFRNGSFCAFRTIEQDERALVDFAERAAAQYNVRPEYVKAKLAGRWQDGRVVLPPEQDAGASAGAQAATPSDEELNDFDFKKDPDGLGCPFGAHIRRMNPRADRVVPFRRRPLIRRGMPYGRAYRDAPNETRGLLGLFFCASLEDQFEFVLREWGNAKPMGPPNPGSAADPFSAGRQPPRAVFDVPMPGEDTRPFDGLQPFLTTRGTLYAFYPGLAAVDRIARCGKP
jgi:deferrochelatase/peroxidase EfeB